jgi:hypothetical protein
VPQSDKNQRVSEVDSNVSVHMALRRWASNIYGGFHEPRSNPVDAVSLTRRDGGVWLCVVKRLNTSTGEREVLFGHGAGLIEALLDANAMAAGGRWTKDKPWAGRT